MVIPQHQQRIYVPRRYIHEARRLWLFAVATYLSPMQRNIIQQSLLYYPALLFYMVPCHHDADRFKIHQRIFFRNHCGFVLLGIGMLTKHPSMSVLQM